MTNYESCRRYSDETLGRFRRDLDALGLGNRAVVTCGSYARREASVDSDVDFFVLSDVEDEDDECVQRVQSAIADIVQHGPANDGAFRGAVKCDDILQNIGGNDDDNKNITRRVLLLLEGEWLYNQDQLYDLRRQILERYVADEIADHQLALFLLNDIIRYYRTVAVDYEFKTIENENPKPWALRNIKLVFSRKLLYASGLFSVAMTADRSREKKIELLDHLFRLPVIDRMIHICGSSGMETVLGHYDAYLEFVGNSENRKHLDGLKRTDREDPRFREIKNKGHVFTRQLLKLLENTFESTHPIHRAVVF